MACHKRSAGFRQGNGCRALGQRNFEGPFLEEVFSIPSCETAVQFTMLILVIWKTTANWHQKLLKIVVQVSSVGVSTTLGLARAQQWQEALLAVRTTPPKAWWFFKHAFSSLGHSHFSRKSRIKWKRFPLDDLMMRTSYIQSGTSWTNSWKLVVGLLRSLRNATYILVFPIFRQTQKKSRGRIQDWDASHFQT